MWDLFQRLPRFGGKARGEFEREYDSRFRPYVSDGKSLQAWVDLPIKIAQALNREGSKGKTEHGKGGFQLPMTSIIGHVARVNRFVTISEYGPLTNDFKLDVKHCRTLSEA